MILMAGEREERLGGWGFKLSWGLVGPEMAFQ